MDDYDRQHLGGLARRVLAERPPVADATRELATGVIDLLVLVAAMERGLVGPRRPAWYLAADLDEARQ